MADMAEYPLRDSLLNANCAPPMLCGVAGHRSLSKQGRQFHRYPDSR